MKTPITYYGGKQKLASTIIGMMPTHKIYCEPFFGGGAVFFAKGKSFLEVINDHNDVLMTFYRVCQDENSFTRLRELISSTLDSETEWLRAQRIYHHPKGHSEVDIAWSVWLTTNMSYSGSPNCGWKWDNGTSGTHSGQTMNNYRNEFCLKVFERLRFVQISCRDALTVIQERDSKETFFYLDPPYPGRIQQHYKGYGNEDFEALLAMLKNIDGKFILSNFMSPLLKKYIKENKWNYKTIDMPLLVANFNKKEIRRKQEGLVYNYTTHPTLFDTL
ncbi:MAG: DNA adenine methylase [Prevotella sp.]|nr:DNA adenine methylase [Prevotella sp.]